MRRLIWVIFAAACGGETEIEKPAPPDLSEVEARFAGPTAALDDASALRIAERVGVALDDAGVLDVVDELVREMLAGASDAVAEKQELLGSSSIFRQNGIELSGEGYVRVHRICSGHEGDMLVDEARDGAIDLAATFTNTTIDPIAWGTMAACRSLRGGARVEATGGLALSLGGPTPILALPPQTLLVSLSALALEIDGDAHALDQLDFRVCTAEDGSCTGTRFEVAVPTGDGTHFLMQVSPGNPVFGLSATNGTWVCAGNPPACSDGAGNQVVIR